MGTNMELILTILGLLLTAAGLIALRPSLLVSPSDAIDRAQPFSVPFKITNAGFLAVNKVAICCYVHRVEVGPMVVTSSLISNPDWNVNTLDRGESKTVICSLVNAMRTMPDIAIVID